MDKYLYQHILKPTRLREGQQENILDLVFTKDEDYINEIDILNSLGKSDHLVIRINVNDPMEYTNITHREIFQIYKGDYSSMSVRTKGISTVLIDPTQVVSKKSSQIQWPVPSINAEPVDIFLGEE